MKTERERMLAELLYIANEPDLKKRFIRAKALTRLFNNSIETEIELRSSILKELFGSVGSNIYIEPPFRCDYGENTYIGDSFYANFGCIILDVAQVVIGNDVLFGPNVSLFTAGHPIDPTVRSSGLEFGKAITIKDRVWIGGNVSVNPGVTIGSNTIIGSGSVVTKSIPDSVIAAGNPCRVIRSINEADTIFWQEQAKEYRTWKDGLK